MRSIVSAAQALLVADRLDIRVQPADPLLGRLDLGLAEGAGRVQHLALEIRRVDDVVVHEPEAPDSRGGQIEQSGGAEPARTDDEDARLEQAALAGEADLGDEHVAAVALSLRLVEIVRGFDGLAGLHPGGEPAGERDRFVAGLPEVRCREERSVAVRAVDDDLRPRRRDVADPCHELPLRKMVSARDAAEVPLVLAPHVDEDGVRVEQRLRAFDVGLDGLAGGHVRRIGSARTTPRGRHGGSGHGAAGRQRTARARGRGLRRRCGGLS